jgi:hypothetical protein
MCMYKSTFTLEMTPKCILKCQNILGMQAVLDVRRLTIVHLAISYIVNYYPKSVFCMPDLDFHTQLMNKDIKLSHSGTVCQPTLVSLHAFSNIIICVHRLVFICSCKKFFQTAYHAMPTCSCSNDNICSFHLSS